MPNASEVVAVAAPANVGAGQPFTASVTYRNVGTTAWTRAALYNLGSARPRDNQIWAQAIRWFMDPAAAVPPGGEVTFDVGLVAVWQPGTHVVAFGMVQDTIEWFGPEAEFSVTVDPPPPAMLPPWRQHADDLVSAQILATGPIPAGGGERRWTNPGPDVLDLRKVRLWTGVSGGCVGDVAATLIRGDGSIVVQQSWDHYAEPTNLDHETMMIFTDDARCLILPGEVLTLGYRFDPFPPLTGQERADHGVTIWAKRGA